MTNWSGGTLAPAPFDSAAVDTVERTKAPHTAVLGAGSWGTTFAKVMADAGCHVTVWGRDETVCTEIRERHRNSRYLGDVSLPEGVTATTDAGAALADAEAVAVALPAQVAGAQLMKLRSQFPAGALALSLIKGVEMGSHRRMSSVIAESLDIDPARVVVISGPNLAAEIALEQPTATVVAATDPDVARRAAHLCASKYFRPYTNSDPVGVELGGAIKNVIAVAVGMAQGAGYGDNTKATIITRGLAEMARFGAAWGARAETFSGLAGMGDLVATCASALSRNHQLGLNIGRGMSLDEAAAAIGRTAEAAATSRAVLELARNKGVDMPITEAVVAVLYGGTPVAAIPDLLLNRPHKAEGA